MKRTNAVGVISTAVMLSALLTVGNVVAASFGGMIDTYFSKNNVIMDEQTTNALTKGKALAKEIQENGTVLLENKDNCLPLKKKENQEKIKVNIFGWGGCDNGFLFQGGGSSEGGYSADKITLYNAFRNNGFEINEELATAYNNLSYRREGGPDQNQHSVYYRAYDPGENFYSDSLMDNAVNFSEYAIVVLSRRATEGDDLPKVSYDENGNPDYSRRYLSLSAKETIMMRKVTNRFDKVIVLVNSSAPMELGFVDYYKIGACLYVGYPGYYGTESIAKIISGESQPSGHLTDTVAYDLRTAPSYVNSGPDATHVYSGAGGRYTDYAEDIYVGYKWYETADEEGYFDSCELNIYGKQRKGYDAIVQYPFGYGLTYTSFDWDVEEVNVQHKLEDGKLSDPEPLSENKTLLSDDVITYKVWVENTGSVPGKEVVGLYYSAPYTKGGIEKSSINLADFQKTDLLLPEKGQYLTLTCKASQMTSYDTYDRNNNGFMGYELEGGKYTLSLRPDVHNVKLNNANQPLSYQYNVPTEGYKYDKDEVTGNEVKNRFTNYKNTVSGATSTCEESQTNYKMSIDGNDESSQYNQGIKYLTRADFKGTFPTTTPIRNMSTVMMRNVFLVHNPFTNDSDVMPKTSSTATSWTLNDVKGLPYDDPKWQQLIEQLSVEQLANLCAGGGFGTIAIDSIKKPKCVDSDGGTGFTSGISTGDDGHAIKYPAANVLAGTWDWKEAYKWGNAIGDEGQALGIQGWYAPGCNVHRSPLGGRNFEYFSEDGYMCGVFVAYTVKGCTENGVYAYMKHFAGNDTDEGRNGQFKWMTEQSLREIWAKPGEIATKVGGANAMMASVDRVGATRTTGSYALLESVLRGEWGFRGSVITDYYQGGNVNDLDEGIRAGNDLALMPGGNHSLFDEDKTGWSATGVIALQKAAHNILFTYIDTISRTEKAQNIDLSSTSGSRQNVSDGTWWRSVLVGVDVVLGIAIVGMITSSIVFTWVLPPKKRNKVKVEGE